MNGAWRACLRISLLTGGLLLYYVSLTVTIPWLGCTWEFHGAYVELAESGDSQKDDAMTNDKKEPIESQAPSTPSSDDERPEIYGIAKGKDGIVLNRRSFIGALAGEAITGGPIDLAD